MDPHTEINVPLQTDTDGLYPVLKVRRSGPKDAHLPCYDFTTLTAVNTCPAWGIVRYIHSRSMGEGGGRAMALEAGQACHRVFAAHRIWHLMHEQHLPAHALHHGPLIFGTHEFNQMCEMGTGLDPSTQRLNFILEALMTSGFYDEPRDRRRTMSNLEECCIAYIDRSDACRRSIWVADRGDATKPIGIEVGFDVRVALDDAWLPFRFVGRVDGIHIDTEHNGEIVIHENKTSSRLDDAWRESFIMSHQTTGYCIGATPYVGHLPTETRVHGLAIPLPKSYDSGGVVSEAYSRHPHQFLEWFKWAKYTAELIERHRDAPETAPQFTHSCNRYFRPCSMIPYCSESPAQRRLMLPDMSYEPWSPLNDGSPVNE